MAQITAKHSRRACTSHCTPSACKVRVASRHALRYEETGALLQNHRLIRFDPDDPAIEYTADVTLGRDQIEALSVRIRKGQAEKEIRVRGRIWRFRH